MTATNCAGTRTPPNQIGHSKPPKQKAPIQLLKAPLQASLAHRERLQQVEGLPPYRNSLRQARAKLPRICLPGRSPCMVDLMSLNPSTTLADFERNGIPESVFQ